MNTEKRKASKRAWRAANREKVREQDRARGRAWRAANLEKYRARCRANMRAWRAANMEKSRARCRAQQRARRAANPQKVLEEQREWRAANPEKILKARQGRSVRLSDGYVRAHLTSKSKILKAADIPDALVELQRARLLLHREIKKQEDQR